MSLRDVADAVLYEGYVLYPYRASSMKNQVRWQWGVLMPADAVAQDASERSSATTQVVVDGAAASVVVRVRFLQAQRRTVHDADDREVERLDVGDVAHTPFDEAVARELELPAREGETVLEVPGGTEVEDLPDGVGRLVRVRRPLRFEVTVTHARPESPYQVTVLTVTLRNATSPAESETTRPQWLRRSLLAAHLLLEVEGGRFLSVLDPPQWASPLVAELEQDGLHPVLGTSDRELLASPVILYDGADVAPESATSFFDALEVDELLSLRTLTLSEEEKREMRGTDPRTAAVLDDVDHMPSDLWERLHGTVRYLDGMTGGARAQPELPPLEKPWWDPGSDASVDPESDAVRIGEVDVRRGVRVVLRPGVRRADAYDLFLAGRTATVAAVLHDVDQGTHLAVTVDDDPGADLKDSHGRYLYFAPDEVEPIRGAN